MSAVNAWSAKEPGGKPAPAEMLFDRGPPDGLSRADVGLFEHTLKDLVRIRRTEARSLKESQDVENSIDAEASMAAPVQAPVRADGNQFARMASAETSEPTPRSWPTPVGGDGTGAIRLTGEKLGFAAETALQTTGPIENAQLKTAAVLPVSGNAPEIGKPMDAGFSLIGFSQEIPKVGVPNIGDIFAEGASLTQQAAEFFHGATLSDFEMLKSAEGEAFLSGGLWERGRPGNLSDLINAVSPRTSFDGGLLPSSLVQTAEPSATHAVGVEFENLFDQFVQGVRLAQRAGATEIQVSLKPDFLGKLSIRALADEYGMRIEIKAESEIVRQIMQDNLADLQQRLAEKGFASDQLNVLADTGWTHGRDRGETPSGAPGHALKTTGETATEVAVEPMPPAKSGMIDYLA